MKRGMIAEFETPEALVAAVSAIHEAGYRRFESYAPYPIEEVLQHGPRPRTPLYALVFGLGGAALAYFIQLWTILDYPYNVGGFPLHSAPAFVPITFETGILFASGAVFLGTLIHLGLPKLHNPLFDVAGFERASVDRFFLAVDATDPSFDQDRISDLARDCGALRSESFGRVS